MTNQEVLKEILEESKKQTELINLLMLEISQEKGKAPKKELDEMSRKFKNDIYQLFKKMGLSANLLGYEYLKTAIEMCFEKPDMIYGITNNLYPLIAKKFNTTTARVERAIRHSLEIVWKKSDKDFLYTVFGDMKKRPTNSVALGMLITYLHNK